MVPGCQSALVQDVFYESLSVLLPHVQRVDQLMLLRVMAERLHRSERLALPMAFSMHL